MSTVVCVCRQCKVRRRRPVLFSLNHQMRVTWCDTCDTYTLRWCPGVFGLKRTAALNRYRLNTSRWPSMIVRY